MERKKKGERFRYHLISFFLHSSLPI